jgi:hypothetical protein
MLKMEILVEQVAVDRYEADFGAGAEFIALVRCKYLRSP